MIKIHSFSCEVTFKQDGYDYYGPSIKSKSITLAGLAEFVAVCEENNFQIAGIEMKVIQEPEPTAETAPTKTKFAGAIFDENDKSTDDGNWHETHELEN